MATIAEASDYQTLSDYGRPSDYGRHSPDPAGLRCRPQLDRPTFARLLQVAPLPPDPWPLLPLPGPRRVPRGGPAAAIAAHAAGLPRVLPWYSVI